MSKADKEELDLDTFGRIIDKFLTENECMMLLTMPEGTQDITVTDNMHDGPVLQFYFLLKAFNPVFRTMFEALGGTDDFDAKTFIDGCLDMVREELMEVANSEV